MKYRINTGFLELDGVQLHAMITITPTADPMTEEEAELRAKKLIGQLLRHFPTGAVYTTT